MRRLIILGLIAASLIAIYVVADLEAMGSAILSMSAESVFIIALLLGINEVIKGLRWAHYLQSSRLEIRTVDALTSYLAAQAASSLPGGAMLGARLAQEHGNVRMRQAAASLVGQGVGDAYALAALASLAILLTGQRPFQLFLPAVFVTLVTAGVLIIRRRNLAERLIERAKKYKFLARFLPQEEDFREYVVRLMTFRTLSFGALYSVGSTVVSAGVLMAITVSLTERGIEPFEALYAHSFSTIARTILPTPGGIGVSDGSLAGILNYLGIGLARATFVALAYRTMNMLFRTAFGVLALIARYPHLLVGQLRVPTGRPMARLPHKTLVRGLQKLGWFRQPATATPPHSSQSSGSWAGTKDATTTRDEHDDSETQHRGDRQ